MTLRRFAPLLACVVLAWSPGFGMAQQTVTWGGGGDGFSFADPGNWAPTLAAINQAALVDNYIVDDAAAFVLIDVAVNDGIDLTPAPGGSLTVEFRAGTIDTFNSLDPLAIEPAGGYSGDADPTTTEILLIDGADVFGHFVGGGIQVRLNSGSLTLRGVGNPIPGGSTIDFGGSYTGQLFSYETPANFLTEHLGKLLVNGLPAINGVNLLIGSDGGVGTLVETPPDPVTPGDLNGDGMVNAADWGIFRSNLFTSFEPASRLDGYLLGDLDGDNDTDEVDFGLYKQVYDQVNGPNSFAALGGISVPEPRSAMLAGLLAAMAIVLVRRRPAPARLAIKASRPLIGGVVLTAVLSLAGPAGAVVVVSEDFDYANGPVEGLAGGVGWSGSWGAPTGDPTPPTGLFNVAGGQAIYNGNAGGQVIITQERLLASPVMVTPANAVEIDLDVLIGATDNQIGRGIGVNFMSGGSVAFTLGKRLNGAFGLHSAGLAAASVTLAQVQASGFVGTLGINAVFTYNGSDTLVSLSDFDTTISYTFVGQQIGFDAIQLTGYHQATTSNGIDNLSVDVVALSDVLPTLEIGLDGFATLRNTTSADISLDLYKITSAAGSLNTAYAGIQNGAPQDGFAQGTGVGDGWEKAGGNTASVMGEAFLLGDSLLAVGASVSLGQILSTVDPSELVQFVYRDAATGAILPGYVEYETGVLAGDYNNDGSVDAGDYTVWRDNLETSNTLDNDLIGGVIGQDHYNQWRSNFGAAAVGGAVAAAAVPEPAGLILAMLVLAPAVLRRHAD